MFKIIYTTALKTVLCLIIFLVLLFATLSLAVPSVMGNMCEAAGFYSMAASYYSQSYKYSGDVADISSCCHNAISAGDDDKIITFCEIYIKDVEFEGYAKEDAERQYIYCNLACAKYRTGDKKGALSAVGEAMDGISGFPAANACTALSLEVIKANDISSATVLLNTLGGYQPSGETEQRTYTALKNELEKLVSQN